MFGDELARAVAYADLLAGPGIERGLLGPRELPRLWDRHLLNCAVVAEAMGTPRLALDIGSGAGLPGLVLALLLPDTRFVLVDATRRRVRFIEEVAAALDLTNVQARWARAEALAGSLSADIVVARGVAPLSTLAGWAIPLLRAGGELLAMKGASATEEVSVAGPVLHRLHADLMAIEQYGAGVVDPVTTVVRIRAGAEVRRSGSGSGPRRPAHRAGRS